MYRKFLAALVALVIGVGAIFAEEITAVFVKYDSGKLTVKVDDKDKTYDVDKDAKVKVGKDQKEMTLHETLSSDRYKEGTKMKLTVEKDKVVKVERVRKGK